MHAVQEQLLHIDHPAVDDLLRARGVPRCCRAPVQPEAERSWVARVLDLEVYAHHARWREWPPGHAGAPLSGVPTSLRTKDRADACRLVRAEHGRAQPSVARREANGPER